MSEPFSQVETWRPLQLQEYQVSSLGRVKRGKFIDAGGTARPERILVQHDTSPKTGRHNIGYIGPWVRLNDSTTQDYYFVSELVALAFCGLTDLETETVRHKDGDGANNRADNIEVIARFSGALSKIEKLIQRRDNHNKKSRERQR